MKRLFLLLTWLIALPIGMLAQGTTWQTASLINSGETVSGTLYHYDNSERNDDWYMIEVPEEGTVELTITPDGTLNIDWIALTWLNGDDVTNDFNSTGVGTNKKVLTTTNVGKGTYYINIHRYLGSGDYTLKYVFTPCPLGNDPEPNDIYYQGDILDSGKTVEGRLGYTDATNYTDDDDWYRIDVPEEGTVTLTINPSQENGLNIDWIALKWLNGDDVTNDFNSTGVGTKEEVLTTTNVGKGTYYINIHRYLGHGGYTLKYVFTPCPLGNDPEPNDIYYQGDILDSGKTVEGRLGYTDATNYTDDDDWYRIDVPEEGTVTLTINPSQENGLNIDWIALKWLNGDDVTNDFNSTGVGTKEEVLTTTNVGKGTYYINIHRYLGHGGYTLKYVFTPCPLGNDPEPNDIYNQGDILDSGKTVEGRLGYTDATYYTDDDDWYRIDVPEEGTVTLTINPSQENGLNIDWIALKWLNGDDVTVDLNSIGVGTNKKVLTTNNVGIGTYYINIHRYIGHGGYTLKYKFLANGEVDRIDGDVNGDEEVGVGDLIAVSNYMASGEGSGVTLDDADVNKDGEVGVGDLISISNIMAGIE